MKRLLIALWLAGTMAAWSQYPFPTPPGQDFKPATGREATPPPVSTPPSAGPAQPVTVTLKQAIDMALQQNPTVKQAEAQEREAWWAYRMATALPAMQTSINYSGGSSLNNYPSQNQDAFAQLSQSFGPIGSIRLATRQALQAYDEARANTLSTRITITQSTKDAFYGLLSAHRQVVTARENMKLADDIHTLAEKNFSLGFGPRMDLVNAGIQRAQAKQTLIQAEGTEKQAEATLAPLLGLSSQADVQALGTLELPEVKQVYAALAALADKTHPQILMAQAAVSQARTGVDLAYNQLSPTPSAFFVQDLAQTFFPNEVVPAPNPYVLGLGLTFPIDWGATRSAVRQARDTVTEKEWALDSARLAVSSNVRSGYDTFQAAFRNALVYRDEVLSPSEDLVRMTEAGYKAGLVAYQQVWIAEQTLRQARIQYWTLLQSGHQSLDALEAAVGQSLEPISTP